jgi:hypothetical protein
VDSAHLHRCTVLTGVLVITTPSFRKTGSLAR